MKTLEDYETQIDGWHESDSELSLYEYLGLTWDEYRELVEHKSEVSCKTYPYKIKPSKNNYP
jgi:hypothetical protein